MALVAADIGNGHTTLGVLDGDAVVASWRVSTDDRRTSDEWGVLLRGLLDDAVELDDLTIDGFSVCSAVPSVLAEWRQMLARHFSSVPAVVVEPGVRTGIGVMTDNPREVGSDRIVNAVAAAALFGGPAVVVDFGTATTFDVVNAKGAYVGGAIAPGVQLASEALGRRGAQLRMVELKRPRAVIARNTVEALQSGLLFGHAAQVDGMVHRIAAELDEDLGDLVVIATGHLAGLVVQECRTITDHEPWLTLQGLRLVFERNA